MPMDRFRDALNSVSPPVFSTPPMRGPCIHACGCDWFLPTAEDVSQYFLTTSLLCSQPRRRNNAHADTSFTRMSTICPSSSIIALQLAVQRMFKRCYPIPSHIRNNTCSFLDASYTRLYMHGPPFCPYFGREWMSIARIFSASSCVQHLGCRPSAAMAVTFPTICLSVLFTFTAISPTPCHYSLQFTPQLCRRYDLSPYHSSARSWAIYMVPFTFSSCQGFGIYFLSLLLPSFNFPSFTSNNFACLMTRDPFI